MKKVVTEQGEMRNKERVIVYDGDGRVTIDGG